MNIRFSFFMALIILFTVNIQTVSAEKTKQTDSLKLHSESSERLVAIMRDIFSSTQEDTQETITLSEDELSDMIEAVEELLFYADLMSLKVPENELEENEAVVFSAMANKLYDEALNVQELSKHYDLQVTDNHNGLLLHNAYERMNRTCSACHQLFRDN